ncbi:hypothetical protein KBD18_00395 [Patescibacteria group bacterium]|nr:hypothetical protein [Patescibacteria group bacterium]
MFHAIRSFPIRSLFLLLVGLCLVNLLCITLQLRGVLPAVGVALGSASGLLCGWVGLFRFRKDGPKKDHGERVINQFLNSLWFVAISPILLLFVFAPLSNSILLYKTPTGEIRTLSDFPLLAWNYPSMIEASHVGFRWVRTWASAPSVDQPARTWISVEFWVGGTIGTEEDVRRFAAANHTADIQALLNQQVEAAVRRVVERALATMTVANAEACAHVGHSCRVTIDPEDLSGLPIILKKAEICMVRITTTLP